MKVAIAGASGFVGRALAAQFGRRGDEVLRLVRRSPEAPGEIEWHPESVEVAGHEALEELDALVNLAGAGIADSRWTQARKAEILSSRVQATRSLVALMARCNRRPRVFVSASAVGFYGDRLDEVLAETCSQGEGFLAEVCRAWEDEALIAEVAGIRTVALRLGLVLDRRGGTLARMIPLFRMGFGGRLGNGRQWMSWIALDDLLSVIDRALTDDGLEGAVNAVSPYPVRNASFADTLARSLGRRALLPAPAFVLRAALGELADALLLSSARCRPAKLLSRGFTFRHPELPGALRSVLGR